MGRAGACGSVFRGFPPSPPYLRDRETRTQPNSRQQKILMSAIQGRRSSLACICSTMRSQIHDGGTVQIIDGESTDRHRSPFLRAGANYFCIHFAGCGFMLPYHFGTVAALKDNGVTFSRATASSGGVMAALALLGGADLHLGIRQCFSLAQPKLPCTHRSLQASGG